MPGQRQQQQQPAPITWKQPVAAGLAYSLATYCSLPPLSLWPFTLLGALALIWGGCRIGERGGRRLRPALLAGAATLPVWFAEEVWLVNVTPVGYPLLTLWLAFWSTMIVYAIAVIRSTGWKVPMAVAAPLVWVAVEMLRGEVILTGYPWYFAAHPLIKEPGLCLPAQVLGVSFMSALVVSLTGSLADAAGWSGVRARAGGIAAAVIVLLWTAVSLVGRIGTGDGQAPREIRIGVVQTNIPQGQKLDWSPARQVEDFQRFLELSRAAAGAGPAVVLWPETMFPGWGLNTEAIEATRRFADSIGEKPQSYLRAMGYGFADALCRTQEELGVPLLVGAEAREGLKEAEVKGVRSLKEDRRFNSVAVISGGKVLDQRYDKIDLTPFGEVIPWVWRWPSVQKFVLELGAGGMRFDLAFGRSAAPIDVPLAGGGSLRMATPICFEVTRTSSCRRLVYGAPDGRPADLLVNVSNDGWFGSDDWWFVSSDARRRQHMLTARWRCMELGTPMVRAVNTGISAFIDRSGRVSPGRWIEGSGAIAQADGALVGSVEVGTLPTIYGRVGDVAGWGSLVGGVGLFAAAWWRGRRRDRR